MNDVLTFLLEIRLVFILVDHIPTQPIVAAKLHMEHWNITILNNNPLSHNGHDLKLPAPTQVLEDGINWTKMVP